MKKQHIPLLVLLTVAFSAFIIGFSLGKTHQPEPITLSIPVAMLTEPTETVASEATEAVTEAVITFPIDINTAGKEEFMALPGIGEVLAERILAYRDEIGRFQLPEDLLYVEGIGKKRFEDILDLITIGG